MVLAIIAVLRAGFAYVPLDPAYPRERLNYIVRDAQVAALLTVRDVQGPLPETDAPTIFVDDQADAGAAAPPRERPADSPAYTIYTSGSTGTPKGVQVLHRNVVNLLDSVRKTPGMAPEDVLLAVTSPSFDIAVLEMLLPLTVGARSVIASVADVTDGARLAALLDEHQATVMQATPATWYLLIENGWSGRTGLQALCGGAELPAGARGKPAGAVRRGLGHVRADGDRDLFDHPPGQGRGPARGRDPDRTADPDTSAYVLDRALNAVPDGRARRVVDWWGRRGAAGVPAPPS